MNYLNPSLKKDSWSLEEDIKLLQYVQQIGKKWSQIAVTFPGRNECQIKNRFYSILRKMSKISKKSDKKISPGSSSISN